MDYDEQQARYDDALPRFVRLVVDELGEEALEKHAFLRDAEGTLTLLLRGSVKAVARRHLKAAAKEKLGAYAALEPLATPNELFDAGLADPDHDNWELVRENDNTHFVRLIERRIIGQDWLRGIQPPIRSSSTIPPILVFASHKGGVGRSTALAVASAEFASRGKTVLAIDLDLESPALGGIFLPTDEIPMFGTLDYYVENGRGSLDRSFLENMLAVSPITQGQGRVIIAPAAGARCRKYPQNVVGKLARAYLEDPVPSDEQDKPLSFLDQTRKLISDLCEIDQYDAIFVDARAGLNETTAATIQGLSADVLFFGVDTPQTWEGYRYFLAHLARYKPEFDENDWRYRLKMVHAKAAADPKAWKIFRDRAFDLFAEHLYDETGEEDGISFSFDLDDPTAPHFALPILNDPSYFEFDPIARGEQMMEAIYARTFGTFVAGVAERMSIA